MKLSTRSRYGLKACFYLALNYEQGATALSVLANKTALSKTYLEQLFRRLIKADIIFSERGAQGGYALSRKPSDITIGEVIIALEEEILVADCISGNCCAEKCPTKNIWTRLHKAINDVLESITLQDMIDDYLKGES